MRSRPRARRVRRGRHAEIVAVLLIPTSTRTRTSTFLDVGLFRGPITTGAPYDPRYDLSADGAVNILDVGMMRPYINTSCTNP